MVVPFARKPWTIVAAAAVIVAAVGALAVGGAFNGSSAHHAGSAPAANGRSPLPAAVARSRGQVMGVLHQYERAFSQHDLTAIASLFTPDIFRHGLRSVGCAETRGRQAVTQVYEETFASPRARYRLADLTPSAINVTGSIAWVNSHYAIGPPGSPTAAGSISF